MADLLWQELAALANRPNDPALMVQAWRNLTFLHCPVEPARLRRHIHAELELDLYPDSSGRLMAWLGLVLFELDGIGFPGVPGRSRIPRFPEFNVRTYVHHKGRKPGVWFFSLEAANWFAVESARFLTGLPYELAKMDVTRAEDVVDYASLRFDGVGMVEAEVELGQLLGPALPETFEAWLIERYLLYTVRRGKLGTMQVHHPPYALQQVERFECRQDLLEALDLPSAPWEHWIFSPGVNVEVFPLKGVDL
jgi:uncharacterized protein YqjF (DUF2071 family)